MQLSPILCPYCKQDQKDINNLKRHVKRCGPHKRDYKPRESRDERLTCYYCGQPFQDFKELAIHMQNRTIAGCEATEAFNAESEEIEDFDGANAVATRICNKILDVAVDQILNQLEEHEEMLKHPNEAGKPQAQRDRDGRNRPKNAVNFISTDDLAPGDPVRAKILGVQTENTGYNDAIVKISVDGKPFFLGLKGGQKNNPNYDVLFRAFGPDENKWLGQEFLIGLNWNTWYEKSFVHVFEAPAPQKAAKAR